MILTIASLLGGFIALGGHVAVIWQPWEFVIIAGAATGTYIVANPWKVVADTGRAIVEALTGAVPKQRQYLDLLGILYALMREMRNKSRTEVEGHIDSPATSSLFKSYPTVISSTLLTQFICDYFRLMLVGNARTHEIEALMDEEIHTIAHAKLKPYTSLMVIAEALPALGIIAAVLGVIKAMGAIDQSPKLLGSFIGAALVGTFAGIFLSYAVVEPLALKVKMTREKRLRSYTIVKQTLLAFMNGALPQIALEHGRKMIDESDRPSIDVVETETIAGANRAANPEHPEKAAARA
jgi:chemotaxis protein MotA